MPTHFSSEALKFLRGLARHNDRVWFEERRPLYEQALKAPMLTLIAEVNDAFAEISPSHICPPHKAMMRIYRDIRFSKNKAPYKTQIAAWWAASGLEKTSGAGFYLSLSPTDLTIAAGCYMPEPEQLLAIRRHLLDHHQELRALLANKRLKAKLSAFNGLKLTRAPKGFPADHPAVDLFLQRQWGVSAVLPAEHALEPALLQEVVTRFRLASPIVAFLNTPLERSPRKPLF